MQDFFGINVQRFEGENRGQLKLLAEVVDKKMKKAWSSLTVKTIKALGRLADLIPPMIRDHYASIEHRESNYHDMIGKFRNVQDAQWDWQLNVQCTTHAKLANNNGSIPYDVKEDSFQKKLWKWERRACRYLIASSVGEEGMMRLG